MDARYVPFGESGMHPHLEVDVITIMLEGRLTHEGSIEHGQSMVANQAQVQRAGAKAYKIYDTSDGQLHRIYGGNPEQSKSFDSHTVIDTGLVYKDFAVKRTGETLVYVVNGEAIINGKLVKDGDLIRADVMGLK